MTTRYVGPGGSDSNDGLSWANRKLTLNGVEDTPVAAGDIVYVAPGVYRELLTLDVSGSSGNPITYIGDVTGEHTDGVGGIVRITGSDNDQTATRNYCITADAKNYRTFRGLSLDTCTLKIVGTTSGCTNWTLEDCYIQPSASISLDIAGTTTDWTIRRCMFFGTFANQYSVYFQHTAFVNNANILIENCVFSTGYGRTVASAKVGGITVKNCLFFGQYGPRVATALDTGQTLNVYNCLFYCCINGVMATVSTEFVEDYNCFWGCITNRVNVNTGANSVDYLIQFNQPVLLDGFRLPWFPFNLSKWSQLARRAGTSESSEDFFGITRPVTSSKKSWGPIQYTGAIRETTTVDAGAASIKLPDAGEQFLMRVPITAVSTTISIKCYREADYAGTLPQMILRQPGQSDRTTTDTGSASTWNTLTDTFTPASLPPYVDVFIKSNNTATSGNYDAFFDTLGVS